MKVKIVAELPTQNYRSFAEFWPFYLQEHAKPWTIRFHVAGTALAIALLIYLIISESFLLIPLTVAVGYGPAWVSHFFIQRNRPATFSYPLWSFIADFKLVYLALSGKLKDELHQLNIRP